MSTPLMFTPSTIWRLSPGESIVIGDIQLRIRKEYDGKLSVQIDDPTAQVVAIDRETLRSPQMIICLRAPPAMKVFAV